MLLCTADKLLMRYYSVVLLRSNDDVIVVDDDLLGSTSVGWHLLGRDVVVLFYKWRKGESPSM